MGWILPSLGAALFTALKDSTSKKSLQSLDIGVVGVGNRLLGVFWLLPLVLWEGAPVLHSGFWSALALGGGINFITTLLYLRALQIAPLSQVMPLLAFTPVFMLVTSPVMVGDRISGWGLLGVILITCGTYALDLSSWRKGWWSLLISPWQNMGSRYMLAIALLWSVSSNYDKLGTQASSPAFWCFSMNLAVGLALIPWVWWRAGLSNQAVTRSEHFSAHKQLWFRSLPALLLIGLLGSLAYVAQTYALQSGPAPYVVALKRCSILFSVVFGGLFFQETQWRTRFAGATVMLAGLAALTLGGS